LKDSHQCHASPVILQTTFHTEFLDTRMVYIHTKFQWFFKWECHRTNS